jgi:hypothetical protein
MHAAVQELFFFFLPFCEKAGSRGSGAAKLPYKRTHDTAELLANMFSASY